MKLLTKTLSNLSLVLLMVMAWTILSDQGYCAGPSPDHPEWAAALKASGTPITVYTAKKIYTMDPGRPEADAIAVLDGKVLSTGTMESMKPWLSRYKYTVNDTLKDKIIMPGFVEPHTHFYMSAGFMALSYIGPIELPNPAGGMYKPVATHDDVIAKLTEIERNLSDPNEPIIAYGFDPANQGGSLDRKALDAISKTRPITVIAFAPHFVYLNTPAIKVAGIKDDTTIHGVYKNPDGTLSGVFNETLAVQAALKPVFPKIIALGGVKGLKFMGSIATSVGITTTSDMAYGAINLDTEWKDTTEAESDPNFAVRMRLVPMEAVMHAKYGDGAVDAWRKMAAKGNDKLFIDGIKFWTDGSLPLMSSMVRFPGYLDGSNGSVNNIPWDQLTARMLPWWKAGVQIHCHVNGDLSLDACLHSLAELQDAKPRFDHRFSLEHYSMSTPMQVRRTAKLGAVASVNIYFAGYRSLLHSNHAYGPDRSEAFARLGTLEREGVIFGLHSDYPQVIVPMNPLEAVGIAVTRIAEDGKTVVAPGERIGVDRALRAITIDAAYVIGMEDKVGSLIPGKFADFAVLEGDPYAVDPTKIKDIPVWGTVMSGKLYKSER
jgi:predicted amidohydrolase YtcJ